MRHIVRWILPLLLMIIGSGGCIAQSINAVTSAVALRMLRERLFRE